MPIKLVEVMTQEPGCCFICNGSPKNPKTGKKYPALDLGRDIDWGNNAYICWECADIISDLTERVDREEHATLQKEHQDLAKAHGELEEKYNELLNRAKRVADGNRAKKEIAKS